MTIISFLYSFPLSLRCIKWDWVICELWSCELQLRVASCELRVAVASCELQLRVASYSCELRVAVASYSCELRVAVASCQNKKMKIPSKDNVI